MTTPDVGQAIQFLAANARVIDRHRYERLFEGGAAQPMRDALAAYRNADGGFGHALEPDGRAPTSEPIAAEGGVLFVHDGMAQWPHAPWLVPDQGPRGWTGPRQPQTSRPA